MTVTRAEASGKSDLMLAGKSGNWTITVGSTEASTLTVGAICSPLLKAGTRIVGGFACTGEPPEGVELLLVVGGVVEEVQALKNRQSSSTATCIPLRLKRCWNTMTMHLP